MNWIDSGICSVCSKQAKTCAILKLRYLIRYIRKHLYRATSTYWNLLRNWNICRVSAEWIVKIYLWNATTDKCNESYFVCVSSVFINSLNHLSIVSHITTKRIHSIVVLGEKKIIYWNLLFYTIITHRKILIWSHFKCTLYTWQLLHSFDIMICSLNNNIEIGQKLKISDKLLHTCYYLYNFGLSTFI